MLADLLLQQRLVTNLVVDVGAGSEPLHDDSVGIAHRHDAYQMPAKTSRCVEEAVFHLERLSGMAAFLPIFEGHRPVVGVEGFGPAPSQGLCFGEPGQLVPAAIRSGIDYGVVLTGLTAA